MKGIRVALGEPLVTGMAKVQAFAVAACGPGGRAGIKNEFAKQMGV